MINNELVLWEGMDFSKYQLGDKIIIDEKTIVKYGLLGHTQFYEKLTRIAAKLSLWLWLEYDDERREYEIQFLDFEPPDLTIETQDTAHARIQKWKRFEDDS